MYDYLVTGAAGYLGSHYVKMLLDKGSSVIAIVRRTSRTEVGPAIRNMRLSERYNRSQLATIAVDLAGASAQTRLGALRARRWVHLAAEAYVPASLVEPATVFSNNVSMTLNVLEGFRMARGEKLYVMSSSEVYGSHDDDIHEEVARQPTTPYAASKLACEELALSYMRSYDTPVVVGRAFNSYGPYHRYDVIPIFINAALRGKPIRINGDGRQQRDFTYVSDTIAGIQSIVDGAPVGSVMNIGTGVGTPIRVLAEKVKSITRSDSVIEYGPARQGEVRRLVSDCSLLKRSVGWEPRVNVDEGLGETVDFARRHEELQW